MGEHDGHRSRLRKLLTEQNLRTAPDSLVLEGLLCFAMRRRDVCPVAKSLLDKYGDVGTLLDKNAEELEDNFGVGAGTAALLALVGEASRRAGAERLRGVEIRSPEDARRYVSPKFRFSASPSAYLLCLDDRQRPIRCLPVAEGEKLHADICRMAVAAGSRTVLLARELPGDMHTLSPGDIRRAQELGRRLAGLGMVLLDYIGVSGEFYSSVAERGVFHDAPETRCRYSASYLGLMKR